MILPGTILWRNWRRLFVLTGVITTVHCQSILEGHFHPSRPDERPVFQDVNGPGRTSCRIQTWLYEHEDEACCPSPSDFNIIEPSCNFFGAGPVLRTLPDLETVVHVERLQIP